MNTRVKQLVIGLLGCALSFFMLFLGLWQMEVFQSQADNSAAARASSPAVDLEENLVNDKVGDLYGRQVSAKGTWLAGPQFLVGTEYPLQVVGALRTEGGRTLTVVRGSIPKGAPIPKPPRGKASVTGVILPTQAKESVPLPADAPQGTLGSVRLEQLAQSWPAPMIDGFVTQSAEASAAQSLGATSPEIPDIGGGKTRNRGYALQWWAFAGFGFVATAVAVRSVGRSTTAG